MEIKSRIVENAIKVAVGVSAAAGVMAVAGNVYAEECPAYPPAPCNTVPTESTVPPTTVETTTTTVPDETLANTGNETNDIRNVALGATLAGLAVFGASKFGRRTSPSQ